MDFVLLASRSPWNAHYKLEPKADAELAADQAIILDQDRPIDETRRPEEPPVDLGAEPHIAGPDSGVDRVPTEAGGTGCEPAPRPKIIRPA